MTAAFGLACAAALLAGWQPAAACNPRPPQPPILEGFAYDATAAEIMVRDATSVVAARLALKLDLELDNARDSRQADYVFEVLEGWGAQTARRLTIGGYWLDCAIEPRTGRTFLLYLDGERLMYAVPVDKIDFELQILGEPAWFYDARGRLVSPAEG